MLNITKYDHMDDELKAQLRKLIQSCQSHDQIPYHSSFTEPNTHCLVGSVSESPVSFLSFQILDQETLQCNAFTLPEERKNGYFSELLTSLLSDYEEYNFVLTCRGTDHICADTESTLEALDAEYLSGELLMECRIRGEHLPVPFTNTELFLHKLEDARTSTIQYDLFSSERSNVQIGHCEVTCSDTGTYGCLHHVEISEFFRGQHYGTDLLELVLHNLTATTEISTLSLQVAADNTPAVSLYKKAGFHISETLLYYLY